MNDLNHKITRYQGAITVSFPLRTWNPNNGSTGNSRLAGILKAKRRKREREAARSHTLAARPLPTLPVVVVVTRVAPSGGLDPHDGLGAALKGTIDGIADALGLTNDRDERVTWKLAQRREGQGVYGIEINIASAEKRVPINESPC